MLGSKTFTHLSIDCSDYSSSEPHANKKATVEVLMQQQGLNHSSNKQKDGIKISMPVRLRFIFGEPDH